MSRETRFVIIDPEGLQIVCMTPGGYNPDQLEDVKRRALDGYREALAFRLQTGVQTYYGPDEEVQDIPGVEP